MHNCRPPVCVPSRLDRQWDDNGASGTTSYKQSAYQIGQRLPVRAAPGAQSAQDRARGFGRPSHRAEGEIGRAESALGGMRVVTAVQFKAGRADRVGRVQRVGAADGLKDGGERSATPKTVSWLAAYVAERG
jgi:hypothetical protein